MRKPLIGFIGQGWIGKNYADNFESRRYKVVRYSLEPGYINNKSKISSCDITFIAVPTPTTVKGSDDKIIRNVMGLIGKGKTVVIKSTILPGTTREIQALNKDIFILHSPEFLREAHAREDTDKPFRSIIGIPKNSKIFREKAKEVMRVLPKAKFNKICTSNESEMIKYVSNCLPFTKLVFLNLIYDLCQKTGCDYEVLKETMVADPMISNFHLNAVHKDGRGAGGDCLIKDFAALRQYFASVSNDTLGLNVFKSIEKKNIDLLKKSNKNVKLIESVYGNNTNL